MEGARVCDPLNVDDLKKCMAKLRAFHQLKLSVDHTFDIFAQIDFMRAFGMAIHLFIRTIRRQKKMC